MPTAKMNFVSRGAVFAGAVLIMCCLQANAQHAMVQNVRLSKTDSDPGSGQTEFTISDAIKLVRFFRNLDGVEACESDLVNNTLKVRGNEDLSGVLQNDDVGRELAELGFVINSMESFTLTVPSSSVSETLPEAVVDEGECDDCDSAGGVSEEFQKEVLGKFDYGDSNSDMGIGFDEGGGGGFFDEAGTDLPTAASDAEQMEQLQKELAADFGGISDAPGQSPTPGPSKQQHFDFDGADGLGMSEAGGVDLGLANAGDDIPDFSLNNPNEKAVSYGVANADAEPAAPSSASVTSAPVGGKPFVPKSAASKAKAETGGSSVPDLVENEMPDEVEPQQAGQAADISGSTEEVEVEKDVKPAARYLDYTPQPQ